MANMIPISTVTVGSGGASSIDFTGIPQTYTDLIIKGSARASTGTGANIVNVSFNGSTTGFTDRYIEGSGSAVGSYTDQPRMVGTANGSSTTSNTFSNFETYIPNYNSSNYKSFSADMVQENNTTAAYSELQAGLWSNTSPITSISLTLNSGNFVQYSTATLYGIRKY